MSKRVRIKLNRAAVRALMKSPEMREILPSSPGDCRAVRATATRPA